MPEGDGQRGGRPTIPAERLDYVRDLYVRGRSELHIQAVAAARFNLGKRQIRRYLALVKTKLAASSTANPEAARVRAEHMLLEAYRVAKDASDAKAMAVCAHRLAELHGAIGPRRVEVTGAGGAALGVIFAPAQVPET